jgi:hypothetical protein
MFDFGDAFNEFLASLFTFLNELFNGLFGWLANFFGGLSIDFPT